MFVIAKPTERELLGLRGFNILVVKVLLTCPTSAPRNDLSPLRNVEALKIVDASVALEAMKSFSEHLWYFSEPLIGLTVSTLM